MVALKELKDERDRYQSEFEKESKKLQDLKTDYELKAQRISARLQHLYKSMGIINGKINANDYDEVKKINSSDEAEVIFRGLMKDIENGLPPNKELMKELDEDWNHVIAPIIGEMQESIGEFAVKSGLMSQTEVDKALSERKRE